MYNIYGQYDYYHTREFVEIYPTFESMLSDYNSLYSGLKIISEESLGITYYMLSANYAHSHIINSDEGQFKTKLFALIFQHAPVWQAKLKVQNAIRDLDLDSDDVLKGTKAVYNSAENNAGAPTTDTLDELPYINHQNTTNYKYSKLDGYNKYYDMLTEDVTQEYINKFKILFNNFVGSQQPTVYYREDDSNE